MLLHTFVKGKVEEKFSGHGGQKQLAGRLEDELKRTGETVQLGTLTAKVSKLLSGEPDGRQFFFGAENSRRGAALAAVLGADIDSLQALAGQMVLVLHPGLSEATEFLRGREALTESRFACVEVSQRPEAGGVLDALRDEAQKHDLAVVVLPKPDEAAAAFFRGAKVQHTVVVKARRGWQVQGHESLYQQPPPEPPMLFDDKGNVRVPVEGSLEKRLDYLRDYPRVQQIRDALETGGTPTLSLAEVVSVVGNQGGYYQSERLLDVDLANHLDATKIASDPQGKIWVAQVGKIVHAWGPNAQAFADLLGPHHIVRTEAPWDRQMAKYASLLANPWHARAALDDAAQPVVKRLLASFAGIVDPKGALAWLRSWCDAAITEVLGGRQVHAWPYPAFGAAIAPTVAAAAAAYGPTRLATAEECANLARRVQSVVAHQTAWLPPVAVGYEKFASSLEGAVVLRKLQRAMGAPTLLVTRTAGEPHAVVDIGGGYLLELRIVDLPYGAAVPLTPVKTGQYHTVGASVGWWYGGDVLLGIATHHAPALEGADFSGARRKARERLANDAARSANDDDD